jgi:hypothetical protein
MPPPIEWGSGVSAESPVAEDIRQSAVVGVLAATIPPILCVAVGTSAAKAPGGPSIYPFGWWPAYVANRLAEQAAAREKFRLDHAVEGDGWGVMPAPIGRGSAFHDPDSDIAELVAALAPWLLKAA